MLRGILFLIFAVSTCWGSQIYIVGIAGGSGSGKTTLAKRIKELLPNDVIVISQDSYYKDRSHLPESERPNCIFDHPDAIDFSLLKEHLTALRDGQCIECPSYDYPSFSRTASFLVKPAKIIILEGILIFAIPEIRELLDLKIYMDIEDDIRLLRRLERNNNSERAHDWEIARNMYIQSARPMHSLFVAPSKQFADLIVPRGGENKAAIDLLTSFLQEKVSSL